MSAADHLSGCQTHSLDRLLLINEHFVVLKCCRRMSKLDSLVGSVFCVFLLIGSATVLAAPLPDCPANTYSGRDNCLGIVYGETGSGWEGDKYVGEFQDGEFDGIGAYTFANGDGFVGRFEKGESHGIGLLTFDSGDEYTGEIKQGDIHGLGVYAFESGAKYIGENEDGKPSGFGVYLWVSGASYIGEQQSGQPNGQGIYRYPDGTTEIGTFKDGVLNGMAIQYGPDGRVRKQGVFENDKFLYRQDFRMKRWQRASRLPNCPEDRNKIWDDCFGILNFDEDTDWGGDRYVGEFKNDELNGTGTYLFSDGGVYFGQIRNGNFNGRGVYAFPSGAIYAGDFKDGDRHGEGIFRFRSGNVYYGRFRNDTGEGQGIYAFKKDDEFQGDLFYGEFSDTDFNGEGVYVFADGETTRGVWVDNELQIAQQTDTAKNKDTEFDSDEVVNAASGSGFAVSGDGYVVTNNHVIDGCQDIYLHIKGRKISARVVTFDRKNDLALLKGDFEPEVVLPMADSRPELLQDIYVAGYPFGMGISSNVKVTKGIISSLTGFGNNFSQVQIDAALQTGNSGGPILDDKGNVIGVAVAKLDFKYALERFGSVPENTNFGIKSFVVDSVLDSQDVMNPDAGSSAISKTELGKRISKGTFYISCWMTMAQINQMKTEKVLYNDFD